MDMSIGKLVQDTIVGFGGDVSLTSGISDSHSVVLEFTDLPSIFIYSQEEINIIGCKITDECNHRLYTKLPESILTNITNMGILLNKSGEVQLTMREGYLEISTHLDDAWTAGTQELAEAITAFSICITELFGYFET